MMKTKKIKFIVLLFASCIAMRCLAVVEQPTPLNIYFFGHTEVDVSDIEGRYIRLDVPLMEYRKITEWDISERYLSPETIDVVVLFSYPASGNKEIKVNVRIYEKVGPLVVDEEVGVTDIKKGLNQAVWFNEPVVEKSVVYETTSKAGKASVFLKGIPIRRIALDEWERNKWPYRLRAEAWLECDGCDKTLRLEKILPLKPSD